MARNKALTGTTGQLISVPLARTFYTDTTLRLQDLDQANNAATEVDAFCTASKSSTEDQPLLASFKAWADPICDRKLKTKSQWTLSDQDYLFSTLKSRSAESEWVLQR